MSTRIRIPRRGDFQPGLVLALAKIALIGVWNGRTFLDDDRDLSDVADLSTADPLSLTAVGGPAQSEPIAEPASHPVAA